MMLQAIFILAGLALPFFLMSIQEQRNPPEERIDYGPGMFGVLIVAGIVLALMISASETYNVTPCYDTGDTIKALIVMVTGC